MARMNVTYAFVCIYHGPWNNEAYVRAYIWSHIYSSVQLSSDLSYLLLDVDAYSSNISYLVFDVDAYSSHHGNKNLHLSKKQTGPAPASFDPHDRMASLLSNQIARTLPPWIAPIEADRNRPKNPPQI
jgi:hypothetical protein